MRSILTAFLLASTALCAVAQAHPRDFEIHDADTRSWWHTTEFLSNDSMEGRDTGSVAYQGAADYVAKRFQNAGLKPAGENGTYFQTVPMVENDLLAEVTSFTVIRQNGERLPLQFLQEITAVPSNGYLWQASGELTFRGYCGKDTMHGAEGKIVLCFGTQRAGLPSAAERLQNATQGGARGFINIDDPYFT